MNKIKPVKPDEISPIIKKKIPIPPNNIKRTFFLLGMN